MKRNLYLLLISVLAISCKPSSKKELKITGTLKNAEGKMVYLQETPLGTGQRLYVDSAVVGNDGKFSVKARPAEQSLYHLISKEAGYPFAFVISDAGYIEIEADSRQPNNFQVKGSDATAKTKDFFTEVEKKFLQLNNLGKQSDSARINKADSLLSSINEEGKKLSEDLKSSIQNFVLKSKSVVGSLLVLAVYQQFFSPEEYRQIIDTLAKKFPDHKGMAKVKQITDQQTALNNQKEEGNALLWTGKQAPEFSLPDANGKMISLSSFKGKYVLVDFWASWCMPCRKENPNVVQAYNQFRNKNFTILGVSLDRDKQEWLDAIEKDKLAWTHVSDLKEWESAAVTTFGFNGIPYNILIDPTGKIIAEALHGPALDAKLREVLK